MSNSSSLSQPETYTYRPRRLLLHPAFPALSAGLILLFIISLGSGNTDTGFSEVMQWLDSYFNEATALHLNKIHRYIIEDLRLPRTLIGCLAGATLSVAGVAMQGLFRNPLASPGTLGVNTGAAFGAAAIIVCSNALLPASMDSYKIYAIPAGAFIGAILVTIIIVKIGTIGGRTNTSLLLLSGLAIQAIISACMGLLSYMSTDDELRSLTFWTMGDLGAAGWKELAIVSPILIVCMGFIFRAATPLNLLLLGESEARHMGTDTEKVKRRLIGLTSLAVATAIAFTGSIGFIGLVAPHLLRLIIGADHKLLLPCSALGGAAMLCGADIVARTVSTAEIPVGIITAFIGAPVFLQLLINQRNKG